MGIGRYERDVLAGSRPPPPPEVQATDGLPVQHRASGFTGRVVVVERGAVTLRNREGRERVFPLRPGVFAVDGRTVTLIRPRRAGSAAPARTASGSIAAPAAPARVARDARIFVEGLHDAELIEKVWGDDLRSEGIVVEVLEGVDDLPRAVRRFGPAPHRRLGILVDHLVPGSKEARLAAAVSHPFVLVTGHPYVDVWQAVRPSVLGRAAWPEIPRDRSWKEGVCAALGASHSGELWRSILGRVRSYADLEPGLVGAVEQLLDFLTVPTGDGDGRPGG